MKANIIFAILFVATNVKNYTLHLTNKSRKAGICTHTHRGVKRTREDVPLRESREIWQTLTGMILDLLEPCMSV